MQVSQATKRQWGLRGKLVQRTLPAAPPPFDLAPPQWALDLLDGSERRLLPREWPLSLTVRDAGPFTLVTARAAGAGATDDATFEALASEAYGSLAEVIRSRPERNPVRFWNHIPAIRRSEREGIDRYMVFNAGRFAACSEWFGSPDAFDRLLPTASAVGHAGPDLVVHVLACEGAGVAVENPRQVPSYRYSRRFGPRPPCFARATAVKWDPRGATTILVGGTASIRGEETMHVGHLAAQAAETFENLAALVKSVGADGLSAFEALRVYYVHEADRRAVERMVMEAFPHLAAVEYVRSDLCRPDLLVEIEGVARSSG